MPPINNQYTFYWHIGKREVLTGIHEDDALKNGGYKAKDLEHLDFIIRGDDHRFVWNGGEWVYIGPTNEDLPHGNS